MSTPPMPSSSSEGSSVEYLWPYFYLSIIALVFLLSWLCCNVLFNLCTRQPGGGRQPPNPSASEAPPPLRRIPGKVVAYESSYVNTECAICLEDFRDGEVCRVLSKCNHVYHRVCIDKWLRTNPHCALCRESVRGSFDGSDSKRHDQTDQSVVDV